MITAGARTVFFGEQKRYFGLRIGVLTYNSGPDWLEPPSPRTLALDIAPRTGSAKKLGARSPVCYPRFRRT
jgi:hypothetical protein